jgi:hypothetical protein
MYIYKGFKIPEYKDPRWDLDLDPFMRATIDHITAAIPGSKEAILVTNTMELTQKVNLSYIPATGYIDIYLNGLELSNYNGQDFSINSNEVTFLSNTITENDIIYVEYTSSIAELFLVDSTIELIQQITVLTPPTMDTVIYMNGLKLINYMNQDYMINGNDIIFTTNQHLSIGDIISVKAG